MKEEEWEGEEEKDDASANVGPPHLARRRRGRRRTMPPPHLARLLPLLGRRPGRGGRAAQHSQRTHVRAKTGNQLWLGWCCPPSL